MAQIDSSIYFQNNNSFGDGISSGMKLGQAFKEGQQKDLELKKKKSIDEAISGSFKQNPDGSFTMDRGAAVGKLSQLGYGSDAFDLDNKLQKQGFENEQLKWNQAKQKNEMTGQLLNGVMDQNTYSQALQQAGQLGIDTSKLPQQYDPNFINQAKQQVLTVQQQLENQYKDKAFEYGKQKDERGFGIQEKHNANVEKQQAFDNRVKLATLDNTLKANDGQKTVDKEFAKDYNEWTSGGAGRAQTEISKIKGVINRLKDGKGTTGGFTGVAGDRFTSDDVLKNRSDVQGSAMTLVKTLLSGATSDGDRQAIVSTLWNEADSTDNNIDRLNRFVQDMETKAAETDAKAKYYESTKGTLGGYKPVSQSAQQPNQSIAPKKIEFLKKFADQDLEKMSPEELALVLRDAKGGK